MKALFIILGAIVLGIGVPLTLHEQTVEKIHSIIVEREGEYPSEEFDMEKYDYPEDFARDHEGYLSARLKVMAFARIMGNNRYLGMAIPQAMEMYMESPLEEGMMYRELEIEWIQYMERRGGNLDPPLAYIQELLEYRPDHPLKGEIEKSRIRLRKRKTMR